MPVRRGVEVYKSERKLSEQRLKRRDKAAVCLLRKVLDLFWWQNEKSMMGRTKGVRARNSRMKVFIGV